MTSIPSWQRRHCEAEGDLPRASALLAPLHPGADHPLALETQVYQAILQRRPHKLSTQLNEILASLIGIGLWNGELAFGGWAQEVAGDHAGAQKVGDRHVANWNLSSKNSRGKLYPHWRSRADQHGSW